MSENGQVHSWDEFRKVGRQTVYKAIVGGVLSGVVAASLALWAIVEQLPGKVGLIPEGAVAAFALEAGCPIGWVDYKKAWGRFVIGAVSEDKLGEIPGDFREDARDSDLAARPFLKPGGEEKHQLMINEMPSHSHDLPVTEDVTAQGLQVVNQSNSKTGMSTALEGGSEPHNNMPPYIALYFCKKT